MSHPDKRSSFAQSFFEASGSSDDDDGSMDDGIEKPRRRTSAARRSSRVLRRNTSDSVSMGAAEAAVLAEADVFEGHGSWYADALRQQEGNADFIKEFLTDATPNTNNNETGMVGDVEVLEQYRIMAQCEARLRVKESIGFDLEEYEATHKLSCEETTDKRALYGGSSSLKKFRLPDQKRPSPSDCTKFLKPQEPPLLPPRPNIKLVKQKGKRVPELLTGTVSRERDSIPPGEHAVRCLGCRCSVQVNQLATLVKCPVCNVISPASSTRR